MFAFVILAITHFFSLLDRAVRYSIARALQTSNSVLLVGSLDYSTQVPRRDLVNGPHFFNSIFLVYLIKQFE